MKNDKVSKESKDLVIENVEQIKKMFPEVVSEGKINLEKLKSILGQELDSKEDSYTFNWAGRKDAFRSIQATAKGTLVPDEKESINFKQTKNIFIEGDNLEVLKLLQKSYFNQVKMIYIDPPYNTGHDFVYKDNFKNGIKAYLEQTGQLNGDGVLLTTNPETSGRFHSDWISMMYPRLFLAKNLMREDGVIFVSIDDHEVHNLKRILDEIFGEENFVAQIVWQNLDTIKNDAKYFSDNHEYIMVYAKNKPSLIIKGIKKGEKQNGYYKNLDNDKRGDYLLTPLHAKSGGENSIYEYTFKNGYKWKPPQGTYPRFSIATLRQLEADNKIYFGGKKNSVPQKKTFLKEVSDRMKLTTFWNYEFAGSTRQSNSELADLLGKGIFDNPKPTKLIKIFIDSFTENGDIVLDFFAGSGTTGHAVLESNNGENRWFILVQLPEKTDEESGAFKQGYKTIAEIAKERIRRVIKKLEKEEKTKLKKENIDLGFKVFKLEKSNYKIWENYEGQDIKELTKQLDLFKSPLVNGYDDYNVIYECIVKEGLNLNAEIEKRDINGNTIYKVSDGNQSFHICLDEKIKQENLNKLDLKKDDVFICLDSSLDDSKKVNISLQCKLKTL